MRAALKTPIRNLARWLVCLLVASVPTAAHGQLGTDEIEVLTGSLGTSGDRLGSSVAIGDFNGDGIEDIAIGAPDTSSGIGRVGVHLGHPDGIGGHAFILPTFVGVDNEAGQRFGAALTTGDFDGDGLDDLAIGIPGKLVDGDDNAGEVVVIYGMAQNKPAPNKPAQNKPAPGKMTPSKMTPSKSAPGTLGVLAFIPFDLQSAQIFSQANLAGAVEAGDALGSSLAAGDLDGDGADDLAIGVPREDVLSADGFGQMVDAGAVNIIYGTLGVGLTTSGNLVLHQDIPGVVLNVNDDDQFGFALAIGDFTGDPRADLAVGVPGEFRGGMDGAGAVEIFQSGPDGIDVTLTEQVLSQLDINVQGTPEEDDAFGFALATGDFDGNGHADLAVGVPGESEFLGFNEIGAVQIFYGFTTGLSTVNDDYFDESSGGGPAFFANFNRFGEALAAADFNADGRDDLAIGAPLSNYNDIVNSGSVHVYYGVGNGTGLSPAGDQIFSLLTFATTSPGDQFGFALAAGRLTSTAGGANLAIAVPNVQINGLPNHGAVLALPSVSLLIDDFETGDTSRWSSAVP